MDDFLFSVLHLLVARVREYFADDVLVYGFAGVVELELVLAASHAEDLEAVYFGNESGRGLGLLLSVHLHQNPKSECVFLLPSKTRVGS